MQKFQIVMCIFLLAFTLKGCTQSNGFNSTSTKASSSSLASKASEEPGSSTMVSTPTSTPDLSSTNNKNNLEPASTTEPSINPITNNEYLIIPGKSVGKISLGMTREDVIKLLGNPTDAYNDQITYRSKKDYLSVYLLNSIVKQIEFSSPSFATKEGFNTTNIGDSHDKFIESEFQWRFLQLRFDWDKGGLSFFTFNADLPDDNTEYDRYTSGYIYEGQELYQEPISNAKWKSAQQNSDDSNSNAKDITSLIPTGWHILDVNYENAKAKAEGDLNKDGIQDIAIVIENTADIDDRSLLIAFGTKDNTYSLSIIADNVILGALDGGGWGDPFDGIIIDRGSVVVNDYGGSGQRWYHNYRFRFQENDWYLIGATMGWNHPIKEGTEMAFDTEDYNLLTGDYIFDKIEENGEEKITKGNRGKKKLVKLSDFNIDDM